MQNSIRVDSGTRRIEVNDNGDVILLPLGDDGFTRDFYRMVDGFREKTKGIGGSQEDILESLDRVAALNQEMREAVDKLFGDGTCRKVFGDILPSTDLFMDFIMQLVPFFEEYAAARAKRMDKYSARRSGSV